MDVTTQDMTYPTAGGTQPVRIYKPASAGNQPLPVVVYYHGGGWVIADLNTYDATPRAIAKDANAVVVSVEYRHEPKNKFPAQHEDAVAAYKWALENAGRFGGDPKRVAVMGESAGGNLAINVAIAARDQNLPKPVAQVLVYPVAGVDTNTPSYQANADAKPLNKPMMEWFLGHVIRSDQDKQDPRLDLVGKANLRDLPPATVITAEIDPLMSEGKTLADKLGQAGVQTRYQNYEGVTHEFFGMGAVLADAESAQTLAVQELKQAFGGAGPAATGSATGQPSSAQKP
jgi:acetyl esterase